MAEPRVFLGSTFYDLRQVRSDLDTFIRDIGYIPVRNEGGDIPFGRDEALEQFCFREIGQCDILVSIIGGQYGHPSRQEKDHSISQLEVKTALKLQKQVYIFVEKRVYHEFEIYRSWPDDKRESFFPHHANDIRIHKFILELTGLPNNNPIFQFESSQEIITICKRQWAGLFQGLLLQQAKRPEEDLVTQLRNTLSVTKQLVEYLTEERKHGSDAIKDILLSNHPAFAQIRNVLEIPFRVFFANVKELDELLKDRDFRKVPEIEWQSKDTMEWLRRGLNSAILKIKREIFDEKEKLILLSPQEWKTEYIIFEKL